MTMRRLLMSYIAVWLFSAPLAYAEPVDERVQARAAAYDRGAEAFAARNWALAERIFSELWREQQSWDVAASLGQAELGLKRYRDAAEHLTIAIKMFPPRDDPTMLDEAKRALAEAKRHVGSLTVVVDQPGARVFVDGKPIGQSPLPSEVFIDPGTRTVEARLSGFEPVRRTIDVTAGAESSVAMKFETRSGVALAVPSVSSDPHLEPERRPRDNASISWVPAVVGGVATAGGLAMYVAFNSAANSDEDELAAFRRAHGESACAASAADKPRECSSIADTGRSLDRNRNWATAGLAVAGTAAAATLVYYVVAPGGLASAVSARRSPARISAAVSSDSASISITGSF